ncbi:hypothetical protein HYALB_00011821 [Hymenoscyphus albidus]|uniref:WD40 repeat-like protein n=1 Tax=Hymenoscyphus albidus TaxID=595503 RepID=A0A9N9LQE3_9HELO|nr:hypothetical protein HYALB_00011821 [Hymenoscyphus albidus]
MMEESRKGKTIRSGFESSTFEADVSIHVDRKVGSATISPSGRDIALASTEGLDIIDLDSPLNPPRHLRHGLPWLVADVQWSPFAARDYWVVSTANQKALVWNLNMQEDTSHGAIEHTLHGHTRAITDINFSAHHPDILATCAVDGYVHCWDLRRPRQPVLTFCDWFAGATQVKWNRQESHVLASSHDRWLRIWDERKGSVHMRSINAHESKIYGLDWNRTRSDGIVTCSLDKSIKLWDYTNELDEPERIIRTDFPVWRARYTPFGWGLLAMPQDAPGELHLYDRRKHEETTAELTAPTVATFPGHGNHKVKEFLWRYRGGITDEGLDNRDFQLVSWGQDNQLRLQHMDPEILEEVGFVKGSHVQKNLNLTRRGAVYKTFRAIENAAPEKKSLTMTGQRPGSSGVKVTAMSNTGIKKTALTRGTKTHMLVRNSGPSGKERGNKLEDQKQNQIEWMSGIKFTKQLKVSAQHRKPSPRKLSLLSPELSPDFEDDGDWDSPEALQDEIVRLGKQLPKITFDDVNMDKRVIEVSMNGPWGEEGAAIFIKCTITFPDHYPESKAPTFVLGKTSLMSNDVHCRLRREVHQIASGFVARRQGCLEATLCYLLGEVDLEASTTFFNDGGESDDDLGALADESSSDDEDAEIPAGASAMMSQELDSSATGDMLAPINRNLNVPLPRLCGARFCANGTLACFFPPKQDMVKSLLETIEASKARSRGEPSFETFGRLHNNTSPIPRINAMSLASESKTDSEMSDDSDISSSSDSDSSHYRVGPRRFPLDYLRSASGRGRHWKAGSPTIMSQRSSAAGTGTGTGTGTGIGIGSKNRSLKPKNILVIHQISDLLPAKLVLAEHYAIYGDGPDVCEHNANVAAKYGFPEVADVWRYAAMLLHNEVPLKQLEQFHRGEPILVIARDAMKRNRSDSGSDSGVDLSYDAQGRPSSLSGRVKWGHSPLAKPLISDLIAHYEKTGDVQMLAMLSCVFNEPITTEGVTHSDTNMTQPQTPLSMKTPAFSLDYFPSDAAAWSKYLRTPVHSVISTPKISQTPTGVYGSVGSSNGAWGSDPASASFSCGETPPLRSNRASLEQLNYTQSLSTSPDNPRSFRRVNSGLASSFAASISRPFSIAVSSSPPNPPPSRKRPSPVESMLSLAPSAITWGSTTVLGSVREQPVPEIISYCDEEDDDDDWKPTICTGISLTMENQNAFDDEGCISSGLLETDHSSYYANYRMAYAELLFIWGHPLARLEILKFNGLKEAHAPENEIPVVNKTYAASIVSNNTHTSLHDPVPPPSPIFLGKKDSIHHPASDQCLDVLGYCLKHEIRLEQLSSTIGGGAVGRCERCKIIQRQLRCVICLEPASAIFSPCLSCGCVTHENCMLEYHTGGSTECPGGCDCDCGEDNYGERTMVGLLESREVVDGVIERMRMLEHLQQAEEANAALIYETDNEDEDEHNDDDEEEEEPLEEWGGEDRGEWDDGTPATPTVSAPTVSTTVVSLGDATIKGQLGETAKGVWGVGTNFAGTSL